MIIYSSLTSCDPGDICLTADSLKADKIRVSIVSLSAELHVCKKIAKLTNGTHHVILNEFHFNELVREKVYPPLLDEQEDSANLIRMGFPARVLFHDSATLCAWFVLSLPVTLAHSLPQSYEDSTRGLQVPQLLIYCLLYTKRLFRMWSFADIKPTFGQILSPPVSHQIV
jgi:hypothetical protein